MRPDVRAFRGLRYTRAAGDLGMLLAPPYDVVSGDTRALLAARSPHNVIHVEKPDDRPGDRPGADRFTRARETLHAWLGADLLARDDRASVYVHEQGFETDDGHRVRRGLFAAVRVDPDYDAVRRHELTHTGPREDRIRLLEHLRTQVSPILLLHRGASPLPPVGPPVSDARAAGEHHRLWRLDGETADGALARLAGPLYIADGHHRYATAVAVLEAARARAGNWTGDEPENFVLASLVAADDLLVRATHRIVHAPIDRALSDRLAEWFEIEELAAAALPARVAAASGRTTAIGALGLAAGRGHLLTARANIAAAFPPDRSPLWRRLDVAVVADVVLGRCLGLDPSKAAAAGELSYSPDASFASAEVAAGRASLALLLNPTPVDQVLAISDAGETMPQKSTYFHPKLPTGLVLYPHAEAP